MNRIRRIRRGAVALAGLAVACLGLGLAAPAAFATIPVLPGGAGDATAPAVRTVIRTVVVGGMPGWQIALIAVGAALIAGVLAVLADRARAAHRKIAPRPVAPAAMSTR